MLFAFTLISLRYERLVETKHSFSTFCAATSKPIASFSPKLKSMLI